VSNAALTAQYCRNKVLLAVTTGKARSSSSSGAPVEPPVPANVQETALSASASVGGSSGDVSVPLQNAGATRSATSSTTAKNVATGDASVGNGAVDDEKSIVGSAGDGAGEGNGASALPFNPSQLPQPHHVHEDLMFYCCGGGDAERERAILDIVSKGFTEVGSPSGGGEFFVSPLGEEPSHCPWSAVPTTFGKNPRYFSDM
jgi:hypothetical protein